MAANCFSTSKEVRFSNQSTLGGIPRSDLSEGPLDPKRGRKVVPPFSINANAMANDRTIFWKNGSAMPHINDNEAAIAHDMLPNFETLDPIPDPVDMDQESKEMLAEARARLANTQGKKARRKARERQPDAPRKVTARRKARELESLGLVLGKKNVWEDEEFELDVITTHEPKAVKFQTTDDDLALKREKVRRIKQTIAEKKQARFRFAGFDESRAEEGRSETGYKF
jgi:hypothetical protein